MDKQEIRLWMKSNIDAFDSCTALVESASCEFDLDVETDDTSWIWDMAVDCWIEAYGVKN